MCMRLAHRLAGFATGAALAAGTGHSAAAAVGSGLLAAVTAAGRTSPDIDQYKGWHRWVGHSGPVGHRRITHWWGLPAAAALWLHSAAAPWAAWMLLAGWVSHLAADAVFGQQSRGRGPGVPLLPSSLYVGVGLDAGGWLERWVLVPVLAVAGPMIVLSVT